MTSSAQRPRVHQRGAQASKTLSLFLVVCTVGCGFIGYDPVAGRTSETGDENGLNGTGADTITDTSPSVSRLQGTCGNGVVEADEVCDDGEASVTCHANCRAVVCLDGCSCTFDGDRTWMVCPEAESWDAADIRCRSVAMRLVEVRRASEADTVGQLRTAAGLGESWLGATAILGETTLRWSAATRGFWERSPEGGAVDEDAYTNWAGSEPDNRRRNESCLVAAGTAHRWRDRRCDEPRAFICEGYARLPPPELVSLATEGETVTATWVPSTPSTQVTGYDIEAFGGCAGRITLGPDERDAQIPTLAGQAEACAVQVRAITPEGLGMPSLLRGAPVNSRWASTTSTEGPPRAFGFTSVFTHDVSAAHPLFPETTFFHNDPAAGDSDNTRHYILGEIGERHAALAERERDLAGRPVGFGLRLVDNSGRMQLQGLGGDFEAPYQYNREGTDTLVEHVWDVSAERLTAFHFDLSFRLAAFTWDIPPKDPLFVSEIFLGPLP